jgi:indolepyruvate ferredoxin oxidoreductase beta subunit
MGGEIDSPLISPGGADVILAFEPCEAARALPYLKPDGVMIVCDRAVQPAGSPGYDAREMIGGLRLAVRRLYVLDGERITASCGARCLNVAILGAAIECGAIPCSMEDIEKALEARFDKRRSEMNKAALRLGASMARAGGEERKHGGRHGHD